MKKFLVLSLLAAFAALPLAAAAAEKKIRARSQNVRQWLCCHALQQGR